MHIGNFAGVSHVNTQVAGGDGAERTTSVHAVNSISAPRKVTLSLTPSNSRGVTYATSAAL
jgi:hypothetical protein